jgi:hypothetical protein
MSFMRESLVAVCSLFSIAVLWPNVAEAQEVAGRFQLGLGTPVFTYSSIGTEVGDDPSVEVDVATTNWGVHDAAVLELGYGLSNALVLGGVLQLGGTSTTSELDAPGSEESTQSSFEVMVGPKIDYMFSEGSRVRPFVSGVIALLHSSTSNDDDDDDDGLSMTGVMLQGGVGLRWFATPGFSLDPSLRLGWSTISGDNEQGNTSTDVSASGVSVSLNVGFSGWI